MERPQRREEILLSAFMVNKILILLTLILQLNAVESYNTNLAIIVGDSFSAGPVTNYTGISWPQYVIAQPNLQFAWQYNYAQNGYSLGMVISNQWPLVQSNLANNIYPGPKIYFLMAGVNHNQSHSALDLPEYYTGTGVTNDALAWCAAWSNHVVQVGSSNVCVYAFTITEQGNDSASSYNYPVWRALINSYLLANRRLVWKVQDNASLLPYNPPDYTYISSDTIHPTTLGYQVIAANVIFNLSYTNGLRTTSAINLNVGRLNCIP